ncbi:MAG: TetR/AcrR family transcriptional regulator [Bacteroidales bacterium]
MEEFTQRQEEIIDKAIILIDQKGIQGFTIKNLAKAIGITEGAIYRHFENKKAILSSILTLFREKRNYFYESTELQGKSTFFKMSSILSHYCTIFESNPAIVSVIFAEEIFQNDNELSQKVAEVIQENQAAMLSLIKEGMANKEVREDLDEQMMVNCILGPFRLIVKMWKMDEFDISLKDNINAFLQYLDSTVFIHHEN